MEEQQEETDALAELIDRLIADSDDFSDIEPLIIRRNGKRPVILSVLPVPATDRNRFLGAQALLTIVPVGAMLRPDLALLSRVFGLTPAEAKLAAGLAGGKRLEEMAEDLGVSRETVRNQLKSVFHKTHTHRQSQLVALLARL